MGTNYYVLSRSCETCGHSVEKLHLGKSSAGWCFSLHVHPEIDLNSLEDWIAYLRDGRIIRDEYGELISESEMLGIITERKGPDAKDKAPWPYDSWEETYEKNGAEPGPNNLVRNKIDGVMCVRHGPGTWDLLDCNFS